MIISEIIVPESPQIDCNRLALPKNNRPVANSPEIRWSEALVFEIRFLEKDLTPIGKEQVIPSADLMESFCNSFLGILVAAT